MNQQTARATEVSSATDEPLEVPLEELLTNTWGDPFFAIHYDDGNWNWEFHDERNKVTARNKLPIPDLKIAMEEIRTTQIKMSDIELPILRII